jgi:hypothetical protein
VADDESHPSGQVAGAFAMGHEGERPAPPGGITRRGFAGPYATAERGSEGRRAHENDITPSNRLARSDMGFHFAMHTARRVRMIADQNRVRWPAVFGRVRRRQAEPKSPRGKDDPLSHAPPTLPHGFVGPLGPPASGLRLRLGAAAERTLFCFVWGVGQAHCFWR